MYDFTGTLTKQAQYNELAATGNQKLAIAVEVWNGNTYLETIAGLLQKGSVTVNETAEFRRTCSLEFKTTKTTTIIPKKEGDLLHPATANNIKLWRGFELSTGNKLMAPLGIFRLSKPKVTDTDADISISISGNDLGSHIARQSFTSYYRITWGTYLVTAVKNLLLSRTATLAGRMILQSATWDGHPWEVPVQAFFTTLTNASQTDPFQAAQNIAHAAGMELFFTPKGLVIMRPIPTPSTQKSVLTFETGVNGVVCKSIGRTFDETKEYNGVLALGLGPGGAPVRYTWWTTTPTSPTRTTGPWGKVPFFLKTDLVPWYTQTNTSAQAQINAIGAAQARLTIKAMDSPEFSCVPNAALAEGDCIRVVRSRIGIDQTYVVSGMTIPMLEATPMTVTCRGPSRQVVYM